MFRQLLGKRDSIVAYTGDTSVIGSPCVDALVDDGTVVQALVFDTECQSDIIDNAALVNASVEVGVQYYRCSCTGILDPSMRVDAMMKGFGSKTACR